MQLTTRSAGRRAVSPVPTARPRSIAVRAIPRGGTPCLRLLGSLVCLGHFRTRLRGLFHRSTYFHFFYALQPAPPYAVTNVSRPFRFARLREGEAQRSLARPVPADEEEGFRNEAVQFAAGMVPIGGGQSEAPPSHLRVTYGIGDCISASRDVAMSDVAALLSGRLELDTL